MPASNAVGDDRMDSLEASVDAFFVLVSGFLVFFMQCGFMLLSAGALRQKNVGNIMLQTLLDACFGCLGWYLCGHAIANGSSSHGFAGTDEFALSGVPIIERPVWFFQYAFAASTGAMAGRTKFVAYMLYAFFMTAWVYPSVAHWVWNEDGWLSAVGEKPNFNGSGMLDFAGCSVVHMVGGLGGLVGAMIVGPRRGRFDIHGRPREMPGHSVPLTLMGVFILWFGWYGFNPGSVLGLTGGRVQAVIVCTVSTTLSGVSACISTMFLLAFIKYLSTGEVVFDVVGAGNGALAGLVGITASCAFVQPWSAILIGIISAFVFTSSSFFVLNILKTDDPLDAVAMHAFCGAWGLIAAGVFADRELLNAAGYNLDSQTFGFLLGGNGKLLLASIVGILAVSLWVFLLMIPFFFILYLVGWLHASPSQESMGLDLAFHGASAFPVDTIDSPKAENTAPIIEDAGYIL